MDTTRAIIVDDEELARSIIREYLAEHVEIEIVAECSNGFEAVKAVTELKPDLLFLDVQMPKLNGFEVLELVESDIVVIFITAYEQYAVRAFEVHAVDYLLKPFSRERFDEALERAKEKLDLRQFPPQQEIISSARPKGETVERVLIRDGSRVFVIPAEKIDYVEAQDDYIAIKSEGKTHLKKQRLSDLQALLDPARFVRVHRSYILNIDRLVRLELYAKDSRMAILKDGTQLQVSRSGYDKLKEML
ncbi:MAG: LytTR family DNA-binding domain-containing protein [Ignavibacteriales bacterium]|nr:LytTR family DNA-binding domain-containing protein [Ignavibacteriales bacterium]